MAQRFWECDLDGEVLDIGEESIALQLFRKPDIECNNENAVGVELFAINDNMYSCESDSIVKNVVGIKITNELRFLVCKPC